MYAVVSPALVLPTITPGLDMRSMIIHALDIHSTITPEGEHGDRLSGKRMSRRHIVLSMARQTLITLSICSTVLVAFAFNAACLLLHAGRCLQCNDLLAQ